MLLLALGVLLIVTVVDLAVGGRAVLVELLVAGPLVAATRCTVVKTALVAALAMAISIPLGLAGDEFFDAEHVSGVVALGIGSLLAVAIAALRSGRERDAARLTVQYDVARVLAESDSMEEAGPPLLEAIARPLGWRAAHLWQQDDDGRLRRTAAWVGSGRDLTDFERQTLELRPEPGQGLPGRVWQARRPVWVTDLSTDENFLRHEGAAAGGLVCGMAFPVQSADRLVAVIELFSHERRELDRPLVSLTEALGAQIAAFASRMNATAAVRASESRASQSRDQLEAMLQGVADAVTVQAPDGRLLFVNDAAVETLGFSSSSELLESPPGEILSRFEILDPDGAAVSAQRPARDDAPSTARRAPRRWFAFRPRAPARSAGPTSRPLRCETATAPWRWRSTSSRTSARTSARSSPSASCRVPARCWATGSAPTSCSSAWPPWPSRR